MAEPVGNGLGFEEIGAILAAEGPPVVEGDALTSARGLVSLPVDGAGNRIRCIARCQCAKAVDSGTLGNVAVRWRNDGTDPTADVGQELSPGESVDLDCGLAALRFIGVAANAKVNVTYLPYTPLNSSY